jgi:hypothetical protein
MASSIVDPWVSWAKWADNLLDNDLLNNAYTYVSIYSKSDHWPVFPRYKVMAENAKDFVGCMSSFMFLFFYMCLFLEGLESLIF